MPVSRTSGGCRLRETLNEFASEEIKQKYLPWVSAGATCAMDLTEPDAGLISEP